MTHGISPHGICGCHPERWPKARQCFACPQPERRNPSPSRQEGPTTLSEQGQAMIARSMHSPPTPLGSANPALRTTVAKLPAARPNVP